MPKLYIWFKARDNDEPVETWENLPGDWEDLSRDERETECAELTETFVNWSVSSGYQVVENHGERS